MSLGDDISVVMITMNEELAVGKVVSDIRHAVPDAEIVIVDSSSDQTPAIAAKLGAKVIRQFPPQGYGRAMDLALRSASRAVIVTMDCDDTYPVDRIVPMANMISAGNWDIVDGSRLKHKPAAMPWINYIANRAFALLASMLFAMRLTDLHSGMRAYRRSAISQVPYYPTGAALPVELLLLPIRLGYRVTSVFIPYSERIGVSTLQPLDSAKWTLKRILSSRFGRIQYDGLKANHT
ncbi:MAG TPA: glycosyltransferase family 2 protein [Terriglobia bacterium]|nr:glycosyltransferase family 2 protein [Terriglobia bacterium]